MEPFLRLQGIRHRYNGRLVLDIPDLQIARGSITGLAGPNGSGKSTLLRILCQIEKSTDGMVLTAGKPRVPGAGNAGCDITLLPQEPYLLRRTVFDNIAYGLRIRGQTEKQASAVSEGLTLVGLDPAFANRRWHELSGGEAQRVALAARLVLQPSCLLLDEPTASVDLNSGLLIRKAVQHAREKWGTTLVIASHQRPWLNDICDRLIFLYNGRQLACSPDNLLPGPWTKTDNDEWCTRLVDGQLLFGLRPPASRSTGVLPPASLHMANDTLKEGTRSLRGTITGLHIDKHLSGPCLQVQCGGVLLHATILQDDFGLEWCRPGREVILHYRPDAIIWLD